STILPLPTSTLFPYTTLFRSSCAEGVRLLVPRRQRSPAASIAISTTTVSLRPSLPRSRQFQAARTNNLYDALATIACASLADARSEEHTSELQSRENLVCRLL